MPPFRLLHFADLHIGMENYGKTDPRTGISTRLGDFLARLDEVTQYALEHDADLVVFAGDAFKTRDPEPTQQREFARRIKQLADHIPVFMLVGNHDIPGVASRATVADIFQALNVPNVFVGRTPGRTVFETKRGPLFLAWMPFPMRGRLLSQDEHRGASVEELDRSLESFVCNELTTYAEEAKAQEMPRLLVGHFTVKGAVFGSERNVMAGRDMAVPKSALADPAWDYVALGHIHKHQNLTAHDEGLPPVVYSGSLERIDFGEAHDPKGFCWIELERGATRWEFVRDHARPFIEIKVDARDETDPQQAALDAIDEGRLRDAVVKMEVRVNEAQEMALRRKEIETALSATASYATLSVVVERETRTPGVGLSAEALTPAQWLERYFAAKNKTPERVQELLRAAESVFNDE